MLPRKTLAAKDQSLVTSAPTVFTYSLGVSVLLDPIRDLLIGSACGNEFLEIPGVDAGLIEKLAVHGASVREIPLPADE